MTPSQPSKLSILVCGALGILETRAPSVLMSASRKSLTPLSSDGTQKELLALQNPHQSRVRSVLACGFVRLAPRGIMRTYYEKCSHGLLWKYVRFIGAHR